MSTATPSDIVAAVAAALGDAPRPVALHEPLFAGNESRYVSSCIEEGWVSSVGAFVDRFERELAAACGAAHAVVMVNGTCAIHAALIALGVKPGDEVLVPALTFVATANAVAHAGAIPHFVEVEEDSLGVCPKALREYLSATARVEGGVAVNKVTGRPIRALVPVHVFGHPCQLEALAAIAAEWHLVLIEDATEALGSLAQGLAVGSSQVAVFSFNGNKIITTGGGGAVVMQQEALYKRLKHLSTTAKQPHPWAFFHDEVAFNYRLPNLNAALGCAQLEQLAGFVAAKRRLAVRYMEAFEGLRGVRILREPQGTQSNYWLVTLLAETADAAWLEAVLLALHGEKFLARPVWQPLHLLPMYRHCPRASLMITENLAQRIISLPSSVRLGLAHG